MTYYNFYERPYSLVVAMDKPQPPTEALVRKTVMAIIRQTLEYGQDPYSQAADSALHNWQTMLPSPPEEEQDLPLHQQRLLEWIMTTEEMQEALMWFRNVNPEHNNRKDVSVSQLDEEQIAEQTVETLLLDLTIVESDWQ